MNYLRHLANLKITLRELYPTLVERIDFPISCFYSKNQNDDNEFTTVDFLLESQLMDGDLVDYLQELQSLTNIISKPTKNIHMLYDLILYLGKIKVFHRDLAFENILYKKNEDGTLDLKLTDFELTNFGDNITRKYLISRKYTYSMQLLYDSRIHIFDLELHSISIISLMILLNGL